MSWLKLKACPKCCLLVVPLLALVTLLLLGLNAAAASVTLGDARGLLTDPPYEPVVQVTTDQAANYSPALVYVADNRLLAVSVRDGNLWSRASTDGGATWAAENQIAGCCRNNPSLARAADGALWLTYDRDGDIWYRTSADQGNTWSAERQLTTDLAGDYDPVAFQAADGKLWVVWYAFRSGYPTIWYTTSTDGGAQWSAEAELSVPGLESFAPTAIAASDGRLVVVWNRASGELWQRSSSNGGVTWSTETRIAACCRKGPSLTAVGGVLWLAYENDAEIWYRTSANQGASWSAETRFTRFVGDDWEPTLAVMPPDRVGIAWTSVRSGNPDTWFGILGVREDISPPPFIDRIDHRPQPNPDSDDPVTFCARALDETGVASVALVWSLDGAAQDDLAMFDDGAHGDDAAGDGVWCAQHAALPEGSQVSYQARATDTDGNSYLYPHQIGLSVLPPFVKTAALLFVPDAGGDETVWFRSYFTTALEAAGSAYDIWDTGLRGTPGAAILNQYTTGAVIWAIPYDGYLIHNGDTRVEVQHYLDAGGKLFISGQNIAQYLWWNGGASASFLNDYLHATYQQYATDLYALLGAAGDPIGDGLGLIISGGDGANNQYSADDVGLIAPAQAIFAYQTVDSAMLAEPIRPAGEPPFTQPRPEPLDQPAENAPSAPAGCSGSCVAGLRVDTGTYRVVYLAFGFEGINSAGQRVAMMQRALAWLNGTPPPPALLTPRDGQSVPVGDVGFTWIGVPGVAHYEIQIDTAPTFDSPDLLAKIVAATRYRYPFTTFGTRYWRVRGLPDGGPPGDWTHPWAFSLASSVTQVTTDAADDTSPALAQTGDGRLLTVFVRNGGLWSRASTDDGATWASEAQIAGCCRYNPSLARAANGALWLAYDRDGDIWYRASADQGLTWTAERKLPTDPGSINDYDPVIFQAADGKLWVVWYSYDRGDYYRSIWYKTSGDGGATWSGDARLTTETWDFAPAAAGAADGRVVVVWQRSNALWQRSTGDGGATWSDAQQIEDGARTRPSLAAIDQDLWLLYEKDGDLWYRTSANQGDTWADEVRFTRFVGPDQTAAATALATGRAGIVWASIRSGNPDIWFGAPVEREDLSPPPYIEWIEHWPAPNPDGDDPITFRALARDETGVSSAHLLWTLDGVAQAELPLYDDGTHGDQLAGDDVWTAQHVALPVGSQVSYRARATDADGNSYRYAGQRFYKVLPPFVKTSALLFVPDAVSAYTPPATAWFRSYYTNALEALGYRYDTWDTELRGAPGSAILSQYTRGAVIWAVPYQGYATGGWSDGLAALQAYLDAGGKLFITGQNIAEALRWSGGEGFLADYLHASFRQSDTGLYALAGAAGDPIGGGLALNISGGDGANDQYSKDEVDPIAPAEAILTYRAGVSAMLAEPIGPPAETVSPQESSLQLSLREISAGPDYIPTPTPPPIPTAAPPPPMPTPMSPGGCSGSCTAGLRVDAGKYKAVYFAFGFEAINRAADRDEVMARVLNWLKIPKHEIYLPLVIARSTAAAFFWADRYILAPGECTTLHWLVADAQAVYLDGVGVPAQGLRSVCPAETQMYVLRVERANVTVEYHVTIGVDSGG